MYSCFSLSQDVGMWTRGGLNPSTFDSTDSERESEAYVTFNGLDVSTDAVLGDYEIWGTGREGTLWTITARSGGELLWVAGGEFSEFETETRRMIATVTSYADSDCKNDNYGKQTFNIERQSSDRSSYVERRVICWPSTNNRLRCDALTALKT